MGVVWPAAAAAAAALAATDARAASRLRCFLLFLEDVRTFAPFAVAPALALALALALAVGVLSLGLSGPLSDFTVVTSSVGAAAAAVKAGGTGAGKGALVPLATAAGGGAEALALLEVSIGAAESDAPLACAGAVAGFDNSEAEEAASDVAVGEGVAGLELVSSRVSMATSAPLGWTTKAI